MPGEFSQKKTSDVISDDHIRVCRSDSFGNASSDASGLVCRWNRNSI